MRILQFTESQVDLSCLMGSVWEGTDPGTGYKGEWPQHSSQSLVRMITRPELPPHEENQITRADLEGTMKLYGGILRVYTGRLMTNERDSLNAFLGLLTGFKRRLFPLGFWHGLALQSHPATLGWIDDRVKHPRRRLDFPSWSWAGWEGPALIASDILDTYDDSASRIIEIDLGVEIKWLNGNELTVEGWVVNLDIRTDPLSELFVAGQSHSIATVKEGRWEMHDTLKSGRYECLVVQCHERNPTRDPRRPKAFVIVLDWIGEVAQRRTFVMLTFFAGFDFMLTKLHKRTVRLV
ncbi:hypothetical protein E8E12_005106 [Didymella heteroderae]|uniref:Uncharacterized protein n=1 Tax=Didymella heteroderae TaxID=1769908 RepID=A0A9P4WJY3_9PLEO|nr:hypothetical protein E8E12_005106 [Didymella heteroderae]